MITWAFAVGMKMVADLKQFSGVNQSILKQTILVKKAEIETKLRETSRLQMCQTKKVSTSHSFISFCDDYLPVKNCFCSSSIGPGQHLDSIWTAALPTM